mmetsp:Transcript_16410/g.48617  ORF Transcript_16410/g.48617 Transcript_16410/m.48617 type:complete len:227 (+) Transcript_16410:202-882(+)
MVWRCNLVVASGQSRVKRRRSLGGRPRGLPLHGLRRDARVSGRVCAALGHRVLARRRDGPRRVCRRPPPLHQGGVHRVAGKPDLPADRPRGGRRGGEEACRRGARQAMGDVRLHLRHPLPPALPRGAGRGRRDPLRHQVHRRPFGHPRRRRHHRVWRVPARSCKGAKAAGRPARPPGVLLTRARSPHPARPDGEARGERDASGETAGGVAAGGAGLLPRPALPPGP